jgi:hypothetical protein
MATRLVPGACLGHGSEPLYAGSALVGVVGRLNDNRVETDG